MRNSPTRMRSHGDKPASGFTSRFRGRGVTVSFWVKTDRTRVRVAASNLRKSFSARGPTWTAAFTRFASCAFEPS